MPYRKPYRKKKPYRRRAYRRRPIYRRRKTTAITRMPRNSGMVYNFRREIWSNIDLSQEPENIGLPSDFHPANPSGDTSRVNWNINATLAQVLNYGEFTALFQHYRLKAIAVTLYPCWTVNFTALTNYSTNGPPSLIMFTTQNKTGQGWIQTADIEKWSEIRAKKTRMFTPGRKPLSVYSRLYQAVETHGGVVNSDYRVSPSKFVSTQEPNTSHFGLACSLATVDGSSLLTHVGGLKYKLRLTHYFQCKYLQ